MIHRRTRIRKVESYVVTTRVGSEKIVGDPLYGRHVDQPESPSRGRRQKAPRLFSMAMPAPGFLATDVSTGWTDSKDDDLG